MSAIEKVNISSVMKNSDFAIKKKKKKKHAFKEILVARIVHIFKVIHEFHQFFKK